MSRNRAGYIEKSIKMFLLSNPKRFILHSVALVFMTSLVSSRTTVQRNTIQLIAKLPYITWSESKLYIYIHTHIHKYMYVWKLKKKINSIFLIFIFQTFICLHWVNNAKRQLWIPIDSMAEVVVVWITVLNAKRPHLWSRNATVYCVRIRKCSAFEWYAYREIVQQMHSHYIPIPITALHYE